jgi:hypothetical protein
MRKRKTTFTKKISKSTKKKGAVKTQGDAQYFPIRLALDEFKVHFAKNRPYIEKTFQIFFDNIFTLWEKKEHKLEFSKNEFRILKYLGLRNDFFYLQLISFLSEYGLDFKAFVALCLEAVLNQDEEFRKTLISLIKKRKGVKVVDKHGKDVFQRFKEKMDRHKMLFRSFRFDFVERETIGEDNDE